jgi:molybdopterin converting factor small subunit
LIKVKVHTIYDLKNIIGKREVGISLPEGCTLRALIDKMAKIWGQELEWYLFDRNGESLKPHILLMVNNQNITLLNGMDTVLRDGDSVIMAPAAYGG